MLFLVKFDLKDHWRGNFLKPKGRIYEIYNNITHLHWYLN